MADGWRWNTHSDLDDLESSLPLPSELCWRARGLAAYFSWPPLLLSASTGHDPKFSAGVHFPLLTDTWVVYTIVT